MPTQPPGGPEPNPADACRYELVVTLADPGTLAAAETQTRLGVAAELDGAMDLVDPDRELPWIQGGPDYIAARVGRARFTARLWDRSGGAA